MKRLKHATAARAFHDALKADDELWSRLTIPIGEMPDGDGGVLELANCRTCLSTIGRPKREQ